jgi:hypothetical protein
VSNYVEFDEVLDNCLDQLVSGRPMETGLADHPAQAGQLAPLLQVAITMRPPSGPAMSAEGWQAGHDRLLARAARLRAGRAAPTPAPHPSSGILRLFSGPRRLATTIAVSIFLVCAILGGGTVSAAGKSLPGSPLYGVKRATETVVGATAFTPQRRSQLHLRWADRRLNEVEALLNQDEGIVDSLLADLDRETEQALIFAGEAGAESLTLFAAQVEQQQETLQQLLIEAPQPAHTGLEKALSASTQRSARAQQALKGAAGGPPSEAPDTLPAAITPEAETNSPASQPTTNPRTPEPAKQAPANSTQDTLPAKDNPATQGTDEKTPPGHDPAHNPNSGQNPSQPPNQPENQGQGQGNGQRPEQNEESPQGPKPDNGNNNQNNADPNPNSQNNGNPNPNNQDNADPNPNKKEKDNPGKGDDKGNKKNN